MPVMVYDSHGLHHVHKRKRIHLYHEKYPPPQPLKRFMDKAVYGVGILGPLLTIPQITKIWIEQNASGVSLIAWSAYLVGALFWVAYGVLHKEKPIIINSALWMIMQILIVVGVVIYS